LPHYPEELLPETFKQVEALVEAKEDKREGKGDSKVLDKGKGFPEVTVSKEVKE
jgi:hypothetical protein